MSLETLKPPEDRKLVMVAKCTDCNWYSSLPTTTFRLTNDMALFKDYVQAHEERYGHKVNVSTGPPNL
jgi:hypothetical protein